MLTDIFVICEPLMQMPDSDNWTEIGGIKSHIKLNHLNIIVCKYNIQTISYIIKYTQNYFIPF